uniref:Uncharacterized protein n=1 Tax=Glossina palpalis gambiensis TaxID=67801 RepID=A0A1B0B7J6_9MUSC
MRFSTSNIFLAIGLHARKNKKESLYIDQVDLIPNSSNYALQGKNCFLHSGGDITVTTRKAPLPSSAMGNPDNKLPQITTVHYNIRRKFIYQFQLFVLNDSAVSPVCHKLFRNFGPGPEMLSTNLICIPGSPDARNGFECQYPLACTSQFGSRCASPTGSNNTGRKSRKSVEYIMELFGQLSKAFGQLSLSFKIKSPSASSSQLSPIPSLSPSSCPELGISGQLSRRQCKSEQAALLSQIVPSGHISAKGTHCEVPFAVLTDVR